MALPPGIYTITNTRHGNFACLPTSNQHERVIGIINPDSQNHQWSLKSSPQGHYSIQNEGFRPKYMDYMWVRNLPEKGDEIIAHPEGTWWNIRAQSNGNYWICPLESHDLSWSLSDAHNETPIQLQKANSDPRCLWKILPFGSEMPPTSGSDMVPSSPPSKEELDILNNLIIKGLEYESPRQGCMKGTRGDILQKIDDWTNDFTTPNIMWIKGYPGVGKSAIATEVVDRLIRNERLGSAFFFQRQNTALNPKALWRRISYDLSRKHPSVRNIVLAKLQAGEVSPNAAHIDRIFRHYVYEPLTGSTEILNTRSPVVVIDALDECGGLEGQTSEDREILLRTIHSWSSLTPNFKIIVTSREEGDIKRLFSETMHYLVEISAGQTVDAQSSDDIRKFLWERLRRIAAKYPNSLSNTDWPNEKMVEQMVIMAAGLFIWAETAIKLIDKADDPLQQLQKVLQDGLEGGLVTLYKQVLDASFREAPQEKIAEFRSIISTIILAKAPISFTSLSALLSIKRFNVENICNRLQSVLEFQSIIRFSHQSFVDFLLDQNKCPRDFFIDSKRENRKLTLACFRVMEEELQFNICEIETSYLRNADIPDLESRAEKNITPHLRYASLHWASHLELPHSTKK